MMSFIGMLKANREVLSHLPEIIEQWHKKETTTTDQSETTDQPETTKQGYVRARWRMNRKWDYTLPIQIYFASKDYTLLSLNAS